MESLTTTFLSSLLLETITLHFFFNVFVVSTCIFLKFLNSCSGWVQRLYKKKKVTGTREGLETVNIFVGNDNSTGTYVFFFLGKTKGMVNRIHEGERTRMGEWKPTLYKKFSKG